MTFAALGLFGFFAVVVGVLFIAVVALGLITRLDTNSFLEWDPMERMEFKGDLESDDMEQMLEQHNSRREARGLAPVTLNEYIRSVRNRQD